MARQIIAQLPAENSFHGLVAFYNRMYQGQKLTLPPHLYPVAQALADERIRKLMVILAPGAGKGQAYDTLVPTPVGTRRWGELMPGNYLFGKDGQPTCILQRHELGTVPIYRVTFDDGSSTSVTGDHCWRVRGRRGRRHGNNHWRTLTTMEMVSEGIVLADGPHGRKNFEIPLNDSVEYPEKPLPMHPYVIGVWLGDGYCRSGSYAKPDAEIADKIRSYGIIVEQGKSSRCPIWRVAHLIPALRDLNLFGKRSWERFIPTIYKENSKENRLEMLRGLLDTDGTVAKVKFTPIYTTTSIQMADDVAWLVRSLGGKARVKAKQKWFSHKGERKQGRVSYDVSITMPDGVNPFHLPRKRDICREATQERYLTRWIKSIEYSHDEEAMCVTVDAADHLYLTNDFIVTHNSVLASIAYPAWLLGIDPTQCVLAISAGATLPQDMMAQTRWLIEDNPDYRLIFPNSRPDRKKGWTDNGLFITGHVDGIQDSSYYATGITSTTVTGKHGTVLILDDIHSAENSRSADACAKVIQAYYDTVLGRRDGRGSRVIVIGRRWHPNDLYNHLKNGINDFVVMECPAERHGTNLFWDVYVKNSALQCCFNENP